MPLRAGHSSPRRSSNSKRSPARPLLTRTTPFVARASRADRPLASRPPPARKLVRLATGKSFALPLKMPPRRRYSNQEYLEMVLCYRECNSITAHAVNLYQQRFGMRVSHHTILDAVYGFREHGRFDPPPVDAGRPPYSAELEEEVLDFFRRHPLASTRDAARVSDNYVWRLLNREGLHPYHFTRVQELHPHDYAARLAFCNWMREERRNILWTDFAISVREFLNGVWYGGERWIGRGGPVPWPPRSPDLTPLDFFLWGRVKDLVYGQTGHDAHLGK